MPSRAVRPLIVAVFVILGIAALVGFTAVLFGGGELIARAISTVAVSTGVMAVTVFAAKRLDRPQSRPTAAFAIMLALVGYCLILSAIWLGALWPGVAERLIGTMFAYIGYAAPAIVFFAVWRQPAGRVAGPVGLGLCAVCLTALLIAIWVGRGPSGAMLLLAVAVISAFAIPVTLCLYGRSGGDRWWRWIGVAVAVAAVSWQLYESWPLGLAPFQGFLVPQGLIIAATIGLLNAMLRLPRAPSVAWLGPATAAALLCTAVAASMANVLDAFNDPFANEIWVKLMAAGVVLTACGFLANVVAMAMLARRDIGVSQETSRFKRLSATCPRCAMGQDLGVGESRCAGCGLVFQIAIVEPRCPACEYVLLDLRSDICPECGARVERTGPARGSPPAPTSPGLSAAG